MAVWDHARTHLDLTESGRVLLRGIVCILLAALIVPSFGILASLVAVLLTALAAGFILRPRIRIRATLPDTVIAGQTVRLRYVLENTARLSAYDLSVQLDALPESIERMDRDPIVERLASGERTEVTLAIRPGRRGRYRVPAPVCRSSFPFNLFVFGASRHEEQTLLVLPPFFPLRLLLQYRQRRISRGGSALARQAEVSTEYAGNRPFLSGDSPRRIDARAWARLAVPATKEYHNDHDSSAMLIMDSRVPAPLLKKGSSPIPQFEAAVSLCASAAYTLARSCRLDLVLIGQTLHPFAGAPGPGRFEAIHHALATVEPSESYDLDPVVPILERDFRETSEVVFILLSWDKMYGDLIEQAARTGCHTIVLLIGRPAADGIDADSRPWAGHVAVLSPDDVLGGRIEQL
jgi:uncharacterized protein (DUF58 family)